MSNPYDCGHCHNEGYDHAPDCPHHPDNLRQGALVELVAGVICEHTDEPMWSAIVIAKHVLESLTTDYTLVANEVWNNLPAARTEGRSERA